MVMDAAAEKETDQTLTKITAVGIGKDPRGPKPDEGISLSRLYHSRIVIIMIILSTDTSHLISFCSLYISRASLRVIISIIPGLWHGLSPSSMS